ncbi:hypothetical protein QR680_009380 [Steinernema hermaphroditum]|uniref:C2H2-type domain-containing protein n=1 Tax=Steinernema hermaphroditum TaxID=289476 RepID=A0AA39M9K8_9BILA|nr:hypothetical protein QR680_009380 [Steinernema hermaphroditum]
MSFQVSHRASCVSSAAGSNELIYKCCECHEEHSSIERLEFHLWRHLRTFSFSCSLCSYPSVSGKAMTEHFEERHPETTDSAIEFKRRLDLESRLRSLLAQSIHLAVMCCESRRQIYEDQPVASSGTVIVNHLDANNEMVGDAVISSEVFQVSHRASCVSPAAGSNELIYKCCECHEEHSSIERLEFHLWACHLRTFPFNCSLCSYPALTDKAMTEHFGDRHPEIADSVIEFKRRLDLETRLRSLLAQSIHLAVLRCELSKHIYEDQWIAPTEVVNHLNENSEVAGDEVFQSELVEEFEEEVVEESTSRFVYEIEEASSFGYYDEQDNEIVQVIHDILPSGSSTLRDSLAYDAGTGRVVADRRPPQKGKKRDPNFEGADLVEVDDSIVELAAPKSNQSRRQRPYRAGNPSTSQTAKPARNIDWIIDAVSKGLDVDTASPHNRRKPMIHTCEYCGKTNKYPSKIEAHMRTHTGERPFVCEICGASFTQKTPLRMHLRRHLNQKPYLCDYPGCNAAFVSGALLNAHKGSKHSTTIRYYPCRNGCGKNFKSVRNQERHENECSCMTPEMEEDFEYEIERDTAVDTFV